MYDRTEQTNDETQRTICYKGYLLHATSYSDTHCHKSHNSMLGLISLLVGLPYVLED